MKGLVFTLCSNNYLAHAATLGDSILKSDPAVKFIIGLVDKKDSTIDYGQFSDFEIIPCFELGYGEFDDMLNRYNIIEFNTAVKPFYFEYLFKKYPDIDHIYYIDPDIVLYQPIEILDREWGDSEIMLTPNLIYLTEKPSSGELASLRHGINNLGFIGLKRGEESMKLISWWKERLREHCRIDKCFGIFVDQKWIDLAPLFFSKIRTVKHPGWNMAWWNFSERKLIKTPEGWSVNDSETPLVFFHFSGYKPEKDLTTERWVSKEFDVEVGSPLAELYQDYKTRLLKWNYSALSKIKPSLAFYQAPNSIKHRVGKKLKSKMNNLIYRLFQV
ncbi:hypothetical protein [Algoriphagus antarcticus]|uniref:Lipopolysaccharide biosynthesis glycosyltransferase n=1 Tax=Algoriphagus antarcticus TaxID=238540 RepID=A0A3E0E3J4_9BACT|nr:hypothetical protein [Algoriphagus antarcticus]REG91516.1 hypothetical protein C8N25_104130 [Algoriphagus antarcticus]